MKIPSEFQHLPEAVRLQQAHGDFTAAIEEERRLTAGTHGVAHLISDRLRRAQDELQQAQEAFDAATGEPKPVGLTPVVIADVARRFPMHQREAVLELLDRSCGRTLPLLREANAQRLEFIRLAVLQLSAGDMTKLREFIELAHVDWRDVVYAAQIRVNEDRKILLSEHMNFEFYTNSSGQHFLEIVCGGSGMFDVCIVLTDDELRRYREWGDSFIQKLALDVQRSPESFIARAIRR